MANTSLAATFTPDPKLFTADQIAQIRKAQEFISQPIQQQRVATVDANALEARRGEPNIQQKYQQPQIDFSQLMARLPEQDTLKQERSALMTRLSQAIEQQQNLPTKLQTLESQAGLPQMQKQLSDINDQIKQLNVGAQVMTETAGQRIAPTFSIQGEQAAIERQRAIKGMSLAAQAQALQGNVANANDLIDRAINIETSATDRYVNNIKEALRANESAMSNVEKERATKVNALLDTIKQQSDFQAQENKTKLQLMTKAAEYGAPNNILNAIQSAQTPEEALIAGAQYMQNPKQKYEMEGLYLSNAIKRGALNKQQADNATINSTFGYLASSSGIPKTFDASNPQTVASLPVSTITKAVISGYGQVKSLTPTQRAQVISEMYKVGFHPQSYIIGKLQELTRLWTEMPDDSKGYVDGLKFWQTSTVPKVADFNSARQILTREIARLNDVGVLSDQDVASYAEAMPSRQDSSLDVVLKKASGIISATQGRTTKTIGQRIKLQDGREAIVGLDGETLLDPVTGKEL